MNEAIVEEPAVTIIAPSFDGYEQYLSTLSVTAGSYASWSLPDINPGSQSSNEVQVQVTSDIALVPFISYEDGRIVFAEDSSSNDLVDQFHKVYI